MTRRKPEHEHEHEHGVSRRVLLGAGVGAIGAWLIGCGAGRKGTTAPDASRPPRTPDPVASPSAPPPGNAYIVGYEPERATPARASTPTCAETEDNIEGPFYKPGAPERGVLVTPSTKGTHLILTGHVLAAGASCAALGKAEVEIWQADAKGGYDNQGYGLRGMVRTDAKGAYRFETIIPGHYLNGPQYRPAHIHVKVHAGGSELLTTQLYFEGDPYNDVDPFIKKALIMKLDDTGSGRAASYDLVVAA